jgi:intracellular sulfur oxidation DsrE/DsrF family protein
MSNIIDSKTARRGFLGRLAAGAAAIGLSSTVPSTLAAETPAASPDPALDAWLGKIKGKHRMVFDVTEPNNGFGAIWPRIYMNTMQSTYPGESTTAVVILRHAGIPLGMTDALWSKYPLGEMFNIKDGDKPATKNIYASITNLPVPGIGIAELLKSGVLVGLCDVALTVYSAGAAQKVNMAPEAVKKEWIAGLLPGIQIVPSGVFGVARTQELGCAYCFAG